MTNATIILMERIRLMSEGRIKGTGELIKVELPTGVKEIEMPEEIHTYQAWKKLGYQVKKGEKATAKFPIWKYTESKNKQDKAEVDEEKSAHMFMKNSAFFTIGQCEVITA